MLSDIGLIVQILGLIFTMVTELSNVKQKQIQYAEYTILASVFALVLAYLNNYPVIAVLNLVVIILYAKELRILKNN